MSNEKTLAAIAEIAVQVLEEMTYIFAEPVGRPGGWRDELIVARLPFSKEKQGALFIAAAKDICHEITANMLGVEPDDPQIPARSPDAVGELANIIGGVLMERMYGSEGAGQLGIPEVKIMDPKELPQPKENDARVFFLDEEERRIDVMVVWNE